MQTITSSDIQRRRKRILLGITGSVAAIKGPELALKLSKELGDAHVAILLSAGGENFWYKAKEYDPQTWQEYCNVAFNDMVNVMEQDKSMQSSLFPVLPQEDDNNNKGGSILLFHAQDEWKGWQKMNDPVLHIQLRDWADVAILAPLSAHTLAKIATGLCDDTLTCVLRAWDFGHTGKKNDKSRSSSGGKPLVLAPAMNTAMWEHPLTRLQLETIQGFWKKNGGLATTTSLDGRRSSSNHGLIRIAEPQIKTLACGEVGNGAMASVECIVKIVQDVLRMGTSIDTGISNVQK